MRTLSKRAGTTPNDPRRTLPRTASLAGLVVVGALALGACGDSGSSSGGSATTDKPGAADVTVKTANPLKFDAPSYTAAGGNVKIAYDNESGDLHSLVIEGNKDFRLLVKKKGEVVTGTVKLAPGTYQLYCDVAGHRSAGMEAKLVIS
jgi:plastocyanin